jgi:PII-like signaling protein
VAVVVRRRVEGGVVVEIVDTTEKLEHFLERIESHIKAGLVTLEKAQIKFYRFES